MVGAALVTALINSIIIIIIIGSISIIILAVKRPTFVHPSDQD